LQLGVIFNIVSAFFWMQESLCWRYAADALAANTSTAPGSPYAKFVEDATDLSSKSRQFASVQRFAEVIILIVIIVAFAVVGVVCLRRVDTILGHL
jgi:hypothetical protein